MYKQRGLFIVFEGIEGSGKSFHSQKLFKKLKKNNLPVVYTREPGGSVSAEKIRKIILSLILKNISRFPHVQHFIIL